MLQRAFCCCCSVVSNSWILPGQVPAPFLARFQKCLAISALNWLSTTKNIGCYKSFITRGQTWKIIHRPPFGHCNSTISVYHGLWVRKKSISNMTPDYIFSALLMFRCLWYLCGIFGNKETSLIIANNLCLAAWLFYFLLLLKETNGGIELDTRQWRNLKAYRTLFIMIRRQVV